MQKSDPSVQELVSSKDDTRQILERRIRAGYQINKADKDGSTPLHRAVILKCTDDVFLYLHSRGANMFAKDKDGNTALHLAIYLFDDFRAKIVLFLVVHGTPSRSVEFMNMKNNKKQTPLLLAATCLGDRRRGHEAIEEKLKREKGLYEVIVELLKAGADPNVQDEDGNTMMHILAKAIISVEAVLFLISNFPKINTTRIKNKKGETAISLIREMQKKEREMILQTSTETLEEVEEQIKNGGIINLRDEESGMTAVHRAVGFQSDLRIFNALRAAGASLKLLDVHGNSPLHYAFQSDNHAIILYMLAWATDKMDPAYDKNIFNVRNEYGNTPLLEYVKNPGSDVETIVFMLSNGADPNLPDNSGNTMMHIEYQKHRPQRIMNMYEYRFKANPDFANLKRVTPRMVQHWMRDNIAASGQDWTSSGEEEEEEDEQQRVKAEMAQVEKDVKEYMNKAERNAVENTRRYNEYVAREHKRLGEQGLLVGEESSEDNTDEKKKLVETNLRAMSSTRESDYERLTGRWAAHLRMEANETFRRLFFKEDVPKRATTDDLFRAIEEIEKSNKKQEEEEE